MNRLRVIPAVLALSLLALTACGGEDSTEPTAAPTSGAATTSAPAASPTTAVETKTDKQLCEQLTTDFQAVQQRMMKELAGQTTPSPELAKQLLGEMEKQMTTLVASGGPDSEVAPAIKEMAGHVTKLAGMADPGAAADDPAAEKAAKDLNAACTKAGAPTNF